MKKLFLFCFIMCSSYAYSQNSKVVLGMLKNAKDSIAANRFESASRILDGAAVYGIYIDSIAYWRDVMKKKGIDLSYEKYKERSFDMSMKYIQDVYGNDSCFWGDYYWIDIAKEMCISKRVAAFYDLALKVKLLGGLVIPEKISKEQYIQKILNTILEYKRSDNYIRQYETMLKSMKTNDIEIKESCLDASSLFAFQDEETKKWGYKDSHGIMLIPCEYDSIVTEFKLGTAIVQKDGIYGFLHVTGISTFNMTDSSSYDTTGGNNKTLPEFKIGDKNISMKDYLENIQKRMTY